jgi:hypothetical protein
LLRAIGLRDHAPDRRNVRGCVLGTKIAPRYGFSGIEFPLKSKNKRKILPHPRIGRLLRRCFLKSLFRVRKFF